MFNDKMLENINSKVEGLSSSVMNQLSFNKMIETQLAQIAAAIPVENNRKIPGQPENSFKKVNAVTTRGGKSTRDPPDSNNKIGKAQGQQEQGSSSSTKTQKDPEVEETTPQDFIDTSYLFFPARNRKQAVNEQFAHLLR